MNAITKIGAVAAVALTSLAATTLSAFAVDIQTVKSDGGITALLVEDYTVPLVAVRFSFKGGTSQDAVGKEGTAHLLTTLLDEGAGDMQSQDFQERLDANGMNYSFNAGRDRFSGGFKTLKSREDDAFELMRMMLNDPRFDADPIERMKASLTNSLQRELTNPGAILSKTLRGKVFSDHPYARAGKGTIESVAAVTASDLKTYRNKVFAQDNLIVGVVGAISADDLKARLDQLFGSLPAKSDLAPVPEAEITTGAVEHVEFPVPQTNIAMVLPGIKREDKDFYAAYLVNYIFGGGSFSSRLYEEVREKRGLAYGAYSSLGTFDHAGIINIGSATGAERANQTLEILQRETERMAKEGPTAEELEKAKKYIVGSYAISNLDTSDKIASVLVAIQEAELGLDYITARADYLNNVTLDDAKRVAKRLYGGKPTIVTVGQKPKS